jgi:hypothetical protein
VTAETGVVVIVAVKHLSTTFMVIVRVIKFAEYVP